MTNETLATKFYGKVDWVLNQTGKHGVSRPVVLGLNNLQKNRTQPISLYRPGIITQMTVTDESKFVRNFVEPLSLRTAKHVLFTKTPTLFVNTKQEGLHKDHLSVLNSMV